MLLSFFGLREQPFGVTPDTRYLYLSPTHREALASLVYGIEVGRGFMGLIAKPGMGKTTILFQLLQRLGNSARTVFIFQTQCDAKDFIRSLLADLGMDNAEGDLVQMHAKLNEVLIQEMHAGRRFVLVVDEAQNLDNSVLEVVRMLSNFETPRAKLMQIVLAGQPQLAEKLAHPSMSQLRQRVSIVARLHPFSAGETSAYIDYRLSVAGHDGPPLFTSEARSLLASASEGIPRNINNLCFNAMSLACAMGQKTVSAGIIQEVLADLDLSPLAPEAPPVETGVAQAAAQSEYLYSGVRHEIAESGPLPRTGSEPAAIENRPPDHMDGAMTHPVSHPGSDSQDGAFRAGSEINLRFSNQIQPDTNLGSRFRLPRLPYIQRESNEDAGNREAAHAALVEE
ncbi:MAG TPA: AAA family ATPase [Terriglobia bacterium]|nr:AAA family ATPase [Terriglobia bacterium]